MKYPPACILIVNDDAGIRQLLSATLTRLFPGCEALTAANATTAIPRLDPRELDLLITDLRLPDRSGAELAREARARGCTMPILMLTELDTFEADVWTSGVNATLAKPFRVAELRSLVRSLIARHG